MASSGEDDVFGATSLDAATSSAIPSLDAAATSDAATSPAFPYLDAAAITAGDKLLSTIKAVEKSAKFKTKTAATFIEKHDFEGLEAYVVQTLTFVQGTEQHHHPGILCSLYQAQISYLVREGRIEDAETVLNEKVKPLLDNGDQFYRPKNLEDQVRKAEKCINRMELPADIHILSLLLDYFGLYFPSSGRSWVRPYVRNPFGKSVGEAKVKAPDKRKRKTAPLLAPDKRKRKTAPVFSGDNSIAEVFIHEILDLHTSICKVPFYLVKEKEERAKAAASEVRKTLLDMLKVTSDLISLAFKYFTVYGTLDPLVAISEFKALSNSTGDLLVPLLSLQHSKSMVLELCRAAINVNKILMLNVSGMKKSKVAVSDEGSIACAGSAATPVS